MTWIYLLLLLTNCKVVSDPLWDEMKEDTILAYSSYCLPDVITDWTCYWCDKVSQQYTDIYCSGDTKHHNQFTFAVRNDDEFVIIFRGSQEKGDISSIMNWIYDFEFWLVDWKGDPSGKSKVHYGFNLCFNDVKDLVGEQLKLYVGKYPTIKKLTITGHSLGAALTDLVGLHFYEEYPTIMSEFGDNFKIFNFGSPRVGNKDFYEYFHTKIDKEWMNRVVNERDMVPGLPPKGLLGYHHFATEYWFRNDTLHYKKCDGSGEDKHCSDSILRDKPEDHNKYLGITKYTRSQNKADLTDGEYHHFGTGQGWAGNTTVGDVQFSYLVFIEFWKLEMENIANNEYVGLQIRELTENIEGNPPSAIASKMLISRAQEYEKIGKFSESIVDYLRSYDLVKNRETLKGALGVFVREMQESRGWLDLCKGEIWNDLSASAQKEDEMKKYVKEKRVKIVEELVMKRYLAQHNNFDRSETSNEVKDYLLEESNFDLHEINNDQLIWGVLNPENQLINGYGIEFRTKKKTLSRKVIYHVFFVGHFSDELREGEGREYDINTNNNPLLFHGLYKDSFLKGKGREFNKEGTVVYEGMYHEGKRHGRGNFYDEKKKTEINGLWDRGDLKLDLNTDKLEPLRVDFHRIELHLDQEKLIRRSPNGDELYKLSSSLFPELGMPPNTYVCAKIFNTRNVNAAEKRSLFLDLEKFFQLVMRLKKNQVEAGCEYIIDYKGVIKGKEIGYLIEFLDYSVASLIQHNVVFGIDEVMRILRDTAACLDYIHSQYIIHMNLNWGNVYLSRSGSVKIGGFDNSIEDTRRWNWMAENNHSASVSSELSGDVIFTAPEIYMGVKSIGVEADVFSFGLMMYSLVMSVLNPFSTSSKCTKCGEEIKMVGDSLDSMTSLNEIKMKEEETEGEEELEVVRARSDSTQQRMDIQRKRTKKNAPPLLLRLAKHLKVCGLEPATEIGVMDEMRKKYEKYGELDFMVRLMKQCWQSKDPEKRPSMKGIVSSFDAEKTKKQSYAFIRVNMSFNGQKKRRGWVLLVQPTVNSLRKKVLECSGGESEFEIKEIKISSSLVETDNDVVKMLGRASQKGGLENSVEISVEFVEKGMGMGGTAADGNVGSVLMELQKVKEEKSKILKEFEERDRDAGNLKAEVEQKGKSIEEMKTKIRRLEKEVVSLQEKLLEATF